VLLNGTPAPLLYVSANQVNAILPVSVAGVTRIVVSATGGCSRPVRLAVAPQEVAVFTMDGSGQIAALNQDNSVNSPSNPAGTGSIFQRWITGSGSTEPPLPDGTVTPVDTRTGLTIPIREVYIGGRTAEVVYAGAAPGLPAGLVQVNVRVPDGVGAGAASSRVAPKYSAIEQHLTVSVQ
jgi:uncharacterized protein (TIGR03437 family)